MSLSNSEMLELLDGVIAKRLAGDAYESYSQRARQFTGTSVPELMKLRDTYQRRVDAESGGGMFRLACPVRPQ